MRGFRFGRRAMRAAVRQSNRSRRYPQRKNVQPKRQKASIQPQRISLPRVNTYLKNTFPSHTPNQAPPQYPQPLHYQQPPPPPQLPDVVQVVSWAGIEEIEDYSRESENELQMVSSYEKIQSKRRRHLTQNEKIVLFLCLGIAALYGISAYLQLSVFHKGSQDTSPTSIITVTVSGSTPIALPTSPPTPTPNPDTHPSVGKTVTGDVWQITFNSVKVGTGDSTTKPQPGDRFLVLNLTMKNLTVYEGDLANIDFILVDSPSTGDDGNIGVGAGYTQIFLDSIPSLWGDTYDPQSVSPGESVRGNLVYEVPVTKHGFDLYCIQFLENTDQCGWYVPI